MYVCIVYFISKWSQHESITELEAVGGYPIMMNEFKRVGGGGCISRALFYSMPTICFTILTDNTFVLTCNDFRFYQKFINLNGCCAYEIKCIKFYDSIKKNFKDVLQALNVSRKKDAQ